ncbi:putative mediator of RNA polymerase II transcription subunit 26 isoform X2 [Vanessa cardui]|uniref:putative mediator of RNA polymerase II transcription subunit 26 isoform X2 n=1 Tax=Vanessa cardui TaxID=171605 RepID=UPI001F12E19D|nr:putative mediator of RNA polymerase II transcription subunit 26 isoform X2 [Vanessa cardui]
MAIPPFPSQDLAKLVLGYLAEEQLMTAYDEFLLASPYLDALRNEYDRIFMTSLRNILAEYRAIKIYVETCKPFLLRKKLFQCSNLLEIVKFLVSYIDINRLHAQESNVDKISSSKNSSNTRSNVCDVCDSLSLETCECKAKTPKSLSMIHPASQIEASTLESSIETTALSDLPGNSVTKNKVTKDSANETATSQTSSTEQVTDVNLKSWNTNTLSSTSHDPQLPSVPPQDNNTSININTQDIISKSDESKQKIEEFNNILNLVCSNNNSSLPTRGGSSQDCTNRTIPNAGTFQEFATGVNEIIDKEKSIVPDSSTSENFNIQKNARIESKVNISQITHIKGPPKAQFLLKVATSNSQHVPASNTNDSTKTPKSELPKIKSLCKQKIDDPKIKILSDVKTILINGTPAYKNKPQQGTNFSYTKDEIMAMPTIILVPASGASQNPTMDSSSTVQSVNTAETTTTTTARMLGPLMIDTVSNNTAHVPSSETMDELIRDPSRAAPQMSSVQPIDITHSSVPKDTNLTVSNKTSTPHVLPPARKSSSTPRRTSHVRVLDFTTPRRILHETINEQDTNKMIPNEVISGENNDFQLEDNVNNDKIVIQKADSNTSITNLPINTTSTKIKKRNWDAELRALAVKNDDEAVITPKLKPEKSKINKKKVSSKDENVQETPESDKLTNKLRSSKKKLSPKTKKSKKKIKSVDKVLEPMEEKEPADKKALDFSMNPTVNIIRESDWSTMEPKENEDYQADIGKNNYSDERVDTPETERLSLQNVIGAKLNISDLLETPYKQVLYDIQMETPKFLGADLPDDPISDIKIMNIPTPRFLATPKPVQATPSSYSSRLTDYSSGGSYYKPDDQDYIPAPEVLECAVTVVQEPIKVVNEKPKVTKVDAKDKSQKTSRPQRKCTKNVSYKSPNITARTKDLESQDVASVSSETSNTSLRDRKSEKSIEPRNRLKAKSKTESKKLVSNIPKSPLKKETPKKYIRIKPFRKTPVKETPNKGRKKTVDMFHTLSAKSLSRKRTTSKEKNTTVLPVLTAVPTKSRRKSSTPRKLHCTKSYNSDNANPNSSDLSKSTQNIIGDANVYCPHDSDTEQQPLRWSDDGSQDAKYKENQSISNADNDDISKIREYIENSVLEKQVPENEGSLHIDLVRRGFDVETARIIERDLLDATPVQDTVVQSSDITSVTKIEVPQNVSDKVEPDGSITNNLQIVQDEVDEEVELSVDECNEGCKNFVTCEFDESSFVPRGDISKLKDTFSMEVCIEDGVSIRLRATPFKDLYEENSIEPNKDYSTNETEAAVSSISNIDKLYTPMKDRRAQCFEIFDSTLTSIDTPLKSENNKDTVYETTVTEIVLEVENIEVKEKTETKKRKRAQSGTSDESLNKKTKPDTQYLLNSANIQNIDIESVLSKLHGP